MSVYVDVSPDLLHWAVDRAGWDEETTRKRAPRFWDWAAGDRRPTLKQLEKFAHDTHAPFGLLFLEEPPAEEIPIPDMRTLGNHPVRRPSADLLDSIYLCQSRQEWFRDFAVAHGLPEPAFIGSATTATSPAVAAREITELLDFDLSARSAFAGWQGALRALIDRIESIGVLVMVNGIVGSNTHRKLDPREFRGFALVDPVAPLIFVNGADTKAAQIFTVIHELAHLWLGGSALSAASMLVQSGADEELWCNRVAAEVLVPRAQISVDFGGQLSEAELKRLAARYKVRTLVVLKRIYDAGFLSWDEFQEQYVAERNRVMSILAEERGASDGGNYYYTQPLRLSRQFTQAVISSTYEGTTTFRDAYQLLGTKKHSTFEGLAAEVGVS